MDITPRHEEGMIRIESYGASGFVVQGVTYDSSIMIRGNHVMVYPDDAWERFSDVATYAPFLMPPVSEMILVGTGAQHQLLAPHIHRTLKAQHGIILDLMNTGAACRTFNVLRSEGRNVDALLLRVR
ncbi:MAG: hypothetical protein EAY65_06215 [Alphaproteobacteria bacterium]|nr:MAG: hypothetical protein EAY65_06215 [Alphaproteobacteria bacterium]